MYYLLSSAKERARKIYTFLNTPLTPPPVPRRPAPNKHKLVQLFVMRSFSHVLLGAGSREAHRVIEDIPLLKKERFQFFCHSGRFRSRQSAVLMMHALEQNVQDLGDFMGLSPEWIKPFEKQIGSFDDAERSLSQHLEHQGKEQCRVGDWAEHWRGIDLLAQEVRGTLIRIAEAALSRWPENGHFPVNVFATSHDICGELSAGKETPIFKPGEVVVYQIKFYDHVNRLYIASSQHYARK